MREKKALTQKTDEDVPHQLQKEWLLNEKKEQQNIINESYERVLEGLSKNLSRGR